MVPVRFSLEVSVSETQENKAKTASAKSDESDPGRFNGMSESIVFHSTFALPRRVAIDQAKKVLGNAVVLRIPKLIKKTFLI